MRLLAQILALLVVVLIASAFSPGARSEASPPPFLAPPLLSCPDVNGDSVINLPGDILAVAQRFGAQYPDPNYLYLYDVGVGDGVINLPNDILYIAGRFGDHCGSLADEQVVFATMATLKYRNCQDALADGYIQYTQFVPSMGIHLAKNQYASLPFYSGSRDDPNDQLRNPIGLICTDSNPDPNIDVANRLIGLWYTIPNPEVCPWYGIDPATCTYTEPVGFGDSNTDEDNTDINTIQKAWHTHTGLCEGGSGTTAWVLETFSTTTQSQCLGGAYGVCPCIWFHTYGWMVHLYNFIPNPDGRYLMWSSAVPGEGASLAGAQAAGAGATHPLSCFVRKSTVLAPVRPTRQ